MHCYSPAEPCLAVPSLTQRHPSAPCLCDASPCITVSALHLSLLCVSHASPCVAFAGLCRTLLIFASAMQRASFPCVSAALLVLAKLFRCLAGPCFASALPLTAMLVRCLSRPFFACAFPFGAIPLPGSSTHSLAFPSQSSASPFHCFSSRGKAPLSKAVSLLCVAKHSWLSMPWRCRQSRCRSRQAPPRQTFPSHCSSTARGRGTCRSQATRGRRPYARH